MHDGISWKAARCGLAGHCSGRFLCLCRKWVFSASFFAFFFARDDWRDVGHVLFPLSSFFFFLLLSFFSPFPSASPHFTFTSPHPPIPKHRRRRRTPPHHPRQLHCRVDRCGHRGRHGRAVLQHPRRLWLEHLLEPAVARLGSRSHLQLRYSCTLRPLRFSSVQNPN